MASYKGYKAFEKNNPEMRQDDELYWKVYGEAISIFGEIVLYESKESLSGKVKVPGRNKIFSKVLDTGEKKDLLKMFPTKCHKCDFSRFFGIRVTLSSVENFKTIFCPNCQKEFSSIE